MDRLRKTERLIRIWLLILRNPERYSAKALPDYFEVNVKTIYRDLVSLGAELQVPVREENKKWIVDPGYFLPPIHLTKPEALNVYLALRLMSSYSNRYDPNIGSTYSVLGSILPSPLKEQIQQTIDWTSALPKDEIYISNMAKLADAWISGHCLKIDYQSYNRQEKVERVVEPYFIEPVAAGHASYLIGYCRLTREVRTFKVNRIKSIEILPETYKIPADFDANQYLGSAWGIMVDDDIKAVKLKFQKQIAGIIQESNWHHSQAMEPQADGSLIMTVKVNVSFELKNWILSWGDRVEVLKPADLRKEMVTSAIHMLDIYTKK